MEQPWSVIVVITKKITNTSKPYIYILLYISHIYTYIHMNIMQMNLDETWWNNQIQSTLFNGFVTRLAIPSLLIYWYLLNNAYQYDRQLPSKRHWADLDDNSTQLTLPCFFFTNFNGTVTSIKLTCPRNLSWAMSPISTSSPAHVIWKQLPGISCR